MAHIIGQSDRRSPGRDAAGHRLAIPLASMIALAFVALGYVVYVLWPRWPEPPVTADAPALPIIVSGVAFNVPPAAIRIAAQRQPGTQERIDLVYLWPSLAPPDTETKSGQAPPRASDRIFVIITGGDGTLSPAERLKVIYPRYTEAAASVGPSGLTLVRFRPETPYQGEDLLFDPAGPERSVLRCSREGHGPMPGMCLHERRLGAADITIRFPRTLLADWPTVLAGIDKLIAGLRSQPG